MELIVPRTTRPGFEGALPDDEVDSSSPLPFRGPISPLVYEAIVNGAGGIEAILEILSYLKSVGHVIPDGFEEAIHFAIERKKFIDRKASSPDCYETLSRCFAEETSRLEVNKPYLYVGMLEKNDSPLWVKLLPPEAAKWFSSPDAFFDLLKEEFIKGCGTRDVLKDSKDLKEVLSSGFHEIQEKMKSLLPPSWYTALAKSLREDMDELLQENFKGTCFQQFFEGDLEERLQTIFQDAFRYIQTGLTGQLNALIKEASSFIPGPLKPILSAAGLQGTANNEFYIEIVKDDRGLFTVKLYGDDPTGSLKFPVTFLDIPEELINEEFWQNLLLYTLWSKQSDIEATFSIVDVYKTLCDQLQKEGTFLSSGRNISSSFELCRAFVEDIDDSFVEEVKKTPPRKPSSAPPETSSKTLLPPFLQDLISQMGNDSFDRKTVTQVLSSLLGKEIIPSLDSLFNELPEFSPAKTLQKPLPKTFSQIFGFNFIEDIKNTRISLLHAVRAFSAISSFITSVMSWIFMIHLLTAFLTICFPGIGFVISVPIQYVAALLLMYGTKVLKELIPEKYVQKISSIFALYSTFKQTIEYELKLILVKIAAKHLINQSLIEEARKQIQIWEKELTKSGEITYLVGKKAKPSAGWTPQTTPLLPPSSPVESVLDSPRSYSPKSYSLDLPMIRKETLAPCIREWVTTSRTISDRYEKLHYLNTFVRHLPIPIDDGLTLWQELDNPNEILDLLGDLMRSFSDFELSTRHEKPELVTSLYALYTMIDVLAKHPKTAERIPPKFASNGLLFLCYATAPGARASRETTRVQMQNIIRFFGGNPHLVYKLEEVEKLQPPSMLFENYDEIHQGNIPKGDRDYLDTLMPGDTDHTFERYLHLFAECPALKPYYLLRSIHLLARNTLLGNCYHIHPLSDITFRVHHENPPEGLLALFHRVTLDYFRTTQVSTSRPIISSGYEKDMDISLLYRRHQIRDSTYQGFLDTLFESKRTQSEIVLQPPAILPYMRNLYKKEIFSLLEMLNQVRADQIIRTMSLFLEKPYLLKDRTLSHLFEIFLLHPAAIFAAFQDRKELLPEMGERFFVLIQKLIALEEPNLALFVAKTANDFLFLCEEFDPDIRLKTCDFRSFVRKEFSSPLSKLVLCSMYLNTSPSRSSREERKEVEEAMQAVLWAYPEDYPLQTSLPKGLEDIIFKTEEVLWTFGYQGSSESKESSPVEEPSPPHTPASEPSEWKVDLTEDDHNLHLLSWFQPLSEIEVYANDDHITSLEFKKLELKFRVKESEGSYKAFCLDPKLATFFIAKRQKLRGLKNYANYLLLENRAGERRVCLPTYTNSVLFGERFLHTVKKAHSPFVEKLLEMMEPSTSSYTYTLKEDGSLDSNDPTAIAYLALLHIAKEDYATARKIVSKLERLGKRKPFSKECFALIESLLLLLFLSPHEKDPTLFLKLVAIFEENRLIQQETSDRSREGDSVNQSQLILFIMTQSTYNCYLSEERKGLSEIDELFILKYITKNCPIPEVLRKFSSSFVNLSMIPLLRRRYILLGKKYLDEEVSFKLRAENAAIALLLGGSDDDPMSEEEDRESVIHPTRIGQLLSLADHPLFDYKEMCVRKKIDFVIVSPLGDLDISPYTLTPNNIYKYFHYYYTMLYEEDPRVSARLSESLSKIHVTFKDPNARLLLYILQTVARNRHRKTLFPSPHELQNTYQRHLLIEACARENAMSSFFSEFKKRVTLDGALSFATRGTYSLAKSALSSVLFPVKAAIFGAKGLATCGHAIYQLDHLEAVDLAPRSDLSDPVDPEIMEALTQRELEIDALLSLSGGEPLEEEFAEPDFIPLPDVSEMSEASVIREFEKINQSLFDYAQRRKKTPVKHVFKGFRQKITRDLLREKEEIEAAVGLPFEEIEKKFLDGDDELFPKEVLLKIYLYKVSSSRWNAFFKRGSLKRAYKFDDLSERALRVVITFEEKGETLIWEKQYGQLKQLLVSPHTRTVCQLLMGFGKTATFMPLMDTLDANGKKVVVNIRPAPIAPSAAEQSAERNHLLFSRLTSTIPLSRSGWTSERLEALYLKIIQIIKGKEEWDGIKEEFQALELRFIEETIDLFGNFEKSSKEEWHKRLALFQKILALLRTRGKAHIDEAHVSFDRKTELCYPIGASHRLQEEHAEIMEEVLLVFFTTPELAHFMSAYKKAPEKIQRSVYETEILPILAHKLANGDRSVEAYFLNRLQTDERNPRLDLLKGALTHLLPSILGELMHVSYAACRESAEEFAIPSEGNENPQEKSTFRNHFSAWMKTALLLTHDRLTRLQQDKFIALLRNRARLELKDRSKTVERLNQTSAGRYFSEHSGGFPLFGFSEDDRDLIYTNLNGSDLFILDYARLVIRNQIRYYEYNISSNSHNFASMFKEFCAYTASLHNRGVFPKGTTVLEDPGTVGETVSLLQERNPPTHVLDESLPIEALQEILSKFFTSSKRFRAIIDRGAIFNGLSNETVARAILEHIGEHQKEIQGVVFYNREKMLMIWEKGALSPIPLRESRIPPENRITYFDQSHTYAADIPQGRGVKAVVTIGEDLIAEDLSQAIWRMRGLKTNKQDVEFVMTHHTKTLVTKEDEPTSMAILQFAVRNQALLSEEDNYFSDLAAISNVLRRRVLDKALAQESLEEMVAIIRAFKDLFLQTNSGDPSDFFGGQDLLVSPYEMFTNLKEKLMHLVSKTGLFTRWEEEEIFEEMSQICGHSYPEKVYKRMMISSSATQTLSIEEEAFEEEADVEEVELTAAVSQQAEMKKEHKKPIPHKSWFSFFDLEEMIREADDLPAFPSSFWTLLTVFSMRQILASHELLSLKAIAPHIDPRILATNNLFLDPPHAFDETQIPPLEALVIEKGHEIQRIILLSKEDALEWRKKLPSEEGNMALFDLNTQLLVKESPSRIDKRALQAPDFQLMLLQIRFLRGDTEFEPFEEALLFPWLERLPLLAIKDYFTEPHRKDALLSSTLEYFIYKKESALHGRGTLLRA